MLSERPMYWTTFNAVARSHGSDRAVGYTLDEKAQIARRYLVSSNWKTNGSQRNNVPSRRAIETIIQDYTREAVAEIWNVKSARISSCSHAYCRSIVVNEQIDSEQLPGILGPRKFESDVAMRTSVRALLRLAWTPVGVISFLLKPPCAR